MGKSPNSKMMTVSRASPGDDRQGYFSFSRVTRRVRPPSGG
jgi:hypothetical protein